MKLKPFFAATACIALLTACDAAEDSGGTTEASSVSATAEAESSANIAAKREMAGERSDATEASTVDDPIPSAIADEAEVVSSNETATAETAGTKSKGKFMTTYDAKRKKSFIPKCEKEMAQDLKPDQIGEACNCLFDESAKVLVGIKERLNPPADKLEAVNEKCLSKYL